MLLYALIMEVSQSWALERRVCLLVEPQILEKHCGFCAEHGMLNHLFRPLRICEGAWEFYHPDYIYFEHLEKAFECVSQSIVWGSF